MPKIRKQQTKKRRVHRENNVGGRLIPASDNIMNERRLRTELTRRIIRTVKPHLGSVALVSDDLAIANILSDLRHYCEFKGLAFGRIQKAAFAMYSEEKAYEAEFLRVKDNGILLMTLTDGEVSYLKTSRSSEAER